MRRTIVMLLLLAGALWLLPPQLEDVSGQCRALESRALREQALQTPAGKEDPALAATVSQRAVAYAREYHYDMPPGLACAIEYWALLRDSDVRQFQPDAAPAR
ncbi:MAG: hypothetical protein IT555_17715 [Acetobacteraceae bacterium]|nr:hypothetical protein [Acetobacteraceae bacterium]